MMRYLSITLENFLVFKGTQTIQFPASDGVVVVYGANGKGKTSLLNAFRFAFTGHARKRGDRIIKTAIIPNREAVNDNGGSPVPCRVTLEFMVDTDCWELTRKIVASPTGELKTEVILVKNNQALSRSDAEQTVAELMPPEVEQCFHFDGELLAQYEQLVEPDSHAGAQLKASIETILGVPILENAERDSRYTADEAGKVLATAAKADKRTHELGLALEQASQLVDAHNENHRSEQARVIDLDGKLRAVTEAIAEQGNKLDLLARRDAQQQVLDLLDTEVAVARDALSSALASGWKAVLVDPIQEHLDKAERERDQDLTRWTSASVGDTIVAAFHERHDQACPVCEQGTGDSERDHILEKFDTGHDDPTDLFERIQAGSERIKTLRRSVDERSRATLKSTEDAYRGALTKRDDAKDDLQTLNDQLMDVSEDDLKALAKQSSDLGAQSEKARQKTDEEKAHLEERQAAAKALRDQIEKLGVSNVDPVVQRTAQVANQLAELFHAATSNYREDLKDSVLQTATNLFTRMRSEASFRQLAINDSFGLQILDPDGQVVELRSAGYEHLVALAQVGAIQAASPIRGPIVMDSPFGRLDPHHVTAVVDNLNLLTNQVILLAHEGEITSLSAHALLGTRLLAEFELVRESHYNTRIIEKRA